MYNIINFKTIRFKLHAECPQSLNAQLQACKTGQHFT